jgi:hypothetical protein
MTHLISPQADMAIAHATRFWTHFTADRNLKARIPEWELGTAVDGALLVSFRVVGTQAVEALTGFAGIPEYFRPLEDDDLRPAFDYHVPGRVVCVWRTAGVWVELWCPDTTAAAPAPAPAPVSRVPVASERSFLGARLKFTRNRKPAA